MSALSRRTVVTGIGLGTAAVAGAPYVLAASAEAAHPGPIETAVIFERLQHGYHTFRVPNLVRAPDGSLLCFVNAKPNSPADWGHAEVVAKRSTDGGKTWGDFQVVAADGTNKVASSALVDEETGRIHVMLIRASGEIDGADIANGTVSPEDAPRPFVIHSDDSGRTWSPWRELTDVIKPAPIRHYVIGPGSGFQLKRGPHRGRLIFPGNHSYLPASGENPSVVGIHTIFSDDHGATWQIGGSLGGYRSWEVIPNETSMVERSDGSVHVNSRDQDGTAPGNRVATTSGDGGATFDGPFRPVADLLTPIVHCSLTAGRVGRDRRLVFAGPRHPTSREQLTIRTSADDGASWREGIEVHDGPAGYSDLTMDERVLGVAFERGPRLGDDTGLSYHQQIVFARVPLGTVDTRPPRPYRTPDRSGHGHHAVLGGRPASVQGRFGKAFGLAGHYVELPLQDATRITDGPFSAALWFRTGLDKVQRLAEAYNVGQSPKWQLEVVGTAVRAQLVTESVNVTVPAPGSYLDGAWHHVVLTRDEAGTVTVYVDGVAGGSRTGVTGSVSAGAVVGVRFGARLDGINNPVVGALDEILLYRRALQPVEITALARANRIPAEPLVHLPLEEVRR